MLSNPREPLALAVLCLFSACSTKYFVPERLKERSSSELVCIELPFGLNRAAHLRFDGGIVGGGDERPKLGERGYPLFGSPSRRLYLEPGEHRLDIVHCEPDGPFKPMDDLVTLDYFEVPVEPHPSQVAVGLGLLVNEWDGPDFYLVTEFRPRFTSYAGTFPAGEYRLETLGSLDGVETSRGELPCKIGVYRWRQFRVTTWKDYYLKIQLLFGDALVTLPESLEDRWMTEHWPEPRLRRYDLGTPPEIVTMHEGPVGGR